MIYMQPPEKFIEKQLRAMGLEGGESLLSEKVLNNSPTPSNNFKSTISHGGQHLEVASNQEPTYEAANFGNE